MRLRGGTPSGALNFVTWVSAERRFFIVDEKR